MRKEIHHPGSEPPPVPEDDDDEEDTDLEPISPIREIDLDEPLPPLPKTTDNRITCPQCGKREMDVEDSGNLDDGTQGFWQRWSCPHCGEKRETVTCPLCDGSWQTTGIFCNVAVTSTCGFCERGYASASWKTDPLSEDKH